MQVAPFSSEWKLEQSMICGNFTNEFLSSSMSSVKLIARVPMKTLPSFGSLFLAGILLLTSVRGAAPSAEADFFEKKIRPVLADNCYECHSGASKKIKGGLRVDSRAALLQGGDEGPAIVLGKPETSRLIAAISHRDE